MVIAIMLNTLLVLVVTWAAKGLPIAVIPKDAPIAFVWRDVIDHRGTLHPA
jgi:hypothetical protein